MDIIPAIDIRGGKCVQLVQGDYNRETVYGDDPVAMAHRWVDAGAARLHVVDLDGARDGVPVNDEAIRAIVRAVPATPIEVAGGIRDLADIERWLAAGVQRVVLGTLAVERPNATAEALALHPDEIAIAVDARAGMAATRGWLETSDTPVDGFIKAMADRGALHVIYTDISRDGMLQHLDFSIVRHLIDVLGETGSLATLIYSGGVTSVEDIIALNQFPLEGAIIGTALYDGRLTVADAKRALATGDGT